MGSLRWALVALVAAGVATPAFAEGDAARGKTQFSRCSACHATTNRDGVGPHLAGVFGRTAGTVAGYGYSKGMAAYAMPWDVATLDAFLAAPAKVVPGTKMFSGPVANPQDRADIIAYLMTLSSPD